MLCLQVACLGVTESDWRSLARSSLQALQLDVARKALIRVRDTRAVEMVNKLEHSRRGGMPDGIMQAEILAYEVRTCLHKFTESCVHMRVCVCVWPLAVAARMHPVGVVLQS